MTAEAGEQSAAPSAESPTPGELLRRERERRGWSVQQAGDELHLDVAVVEALESNRFATLGAPVYARGHLRKYATLLGLTPEDVVRGYERLTDAPAAPTIAPTTAAIPSRADLRWIKAPVAVLAAAALVWFGWWVVQGFSETPAPPPSETALRAPPAAATAPGPTTAPDGPPVSTDERVEAAAAGAGVQQQPEEIEAAPEVGVASDSGAANVIAAAPPGEDDVTLRLEFSGESWAEVYDAAGRRLLFAMGSPGRVRVLSGRAPLEVTLGAADVVSAQVNDAPLVIPRRAGRDAAKFSVDANGVASLGVRAVAREIE